jgi:biliverdin reductase
VGRDPAKTQQFAATYGLEVVTDVTTLVTRSDVDLVVVCHVNCDHGTVVRQALLADKGVVVEYPLSLSVAEGAEIVSLAQNRQQFLHVEHIELLGGVHQAAQAQLAHIGVPTYARYSTAIPQRPAPKKWTYHAGWFGFPLVGALSRLHRLTNLFGPVRRVNCQVQYDGVGAIAPADFFKQCRCLAQLEFQNGLWAEVLYAKGEQTWRSQRCLEVEGDRGALVFDGDDGQLLTPTGTVAISVDSRRGLFAKDTTAVLDAIFAGQPLYVTPQESLYALRVAIAAEKAATLGDWVQVEGSHPFPG